MSRTSAIVFIVIIAAGATFSVIWINKSTKTVEVDNEGNPIVYVEPPISEEESPNKGTLPKKDEPEPEKTPSEIPEGKLYESPEAAMAAIADKVEKKNFEEFVETVGPEAIPDSLSDTIKSMVEDPELSLNKEKPYKEISKSADSVRWALNFLPGPHAGVKEIFADLSETDTDSVQISRLGVPLAIGEDDTGSLERGLGMDLSESTDALTVAHAFSKAIVGRDFETARTLSDPSTVTDERIAALMIAVEEAQFELREERPLVVTLSREDIAWILARVRAPELSSEFAVELGKVENLWKVNGLTFSKVLSALADQAGGGDVAYSPIVEDPSGGDSLVLYFEFDNSVVTPRANRQLAIVADILSQGSERVIRINGHADAVGSDSYNAELSDRRASAIREALIAMGVAPNQVVTEGFGETRPRRPNFNPDGTDNPSGRSENRRAEVFLDF